MKINQGSEHLWKLSIWMLIPISVWVVKEEDGITLVDAGVSQMTKGIRRFFESLNAGPLKRILLTHGHADHIGAIERLRQVYSVPVFAHEVEIPYLDGREAYPRRKKAVELVKKGVVKPLVQEGQQLIKVGECRPYFTPGHSPGHVVYYHEQDQILICGDLFTSKKSRLNRPIPNVYSKYESSD
jgi:glyoxylase-like metal-dependent hydrolase (beta-lactamase superfamily II)